MKHALSFLYILLPGLTAAQVTDTLAARRSLDSLIQTCASQHVRHDYAAVQKTAMHVIELAGTLKGKQSEPVALGYNNLGMAAFNLGDFDLAVRSMEETLRIRLALFGRKNPIIAVTLNNLGLMYARVGQAASAESCFLESVAIVKENSGARHRDVGYVLVHLANLYNEIGRYRDAEFAFMEACGIWKETFGAESTQVATILSNLGLLAREMGCFKEAEQYLQEAVRIGNSKLKTSDPSLAIHLNNLAVLYIDTDRHREAIPYIEQAMQIWENAGDKNKSAFASALNNLANAYAGIGDMPKSVSLLLESLQRLEQAPDRKPAEKANKLNNIAFRYFKMNNLIAADSLYDLAESIVVKDIGRKNNLYVSILINHATLCQATNRLEHCDNLIREAQQLRYEMILEAADFMTEEELGQHLKHLNGSSNQPYSFAVRRTQASDLLAGLCYQNALHSKGFIEETVINSRNRAGADTSARNLLDQLAGVRRKLAREFARPVINRDTTFIRYAESQMHELEKKLTRASEMGSRSNRIVNAKEIQSRLTAEEAAIEFVSFSLENLYGASSDSILYAALVLLPADTAPHVIPLFEERQLQALLNRPELGEELTVKSLYASNSELLKLLWTPLEPLLRNVKTVYYSPAGLLHRVNPAALRDADKRYLSESRAWVRVGSTRELIAGRLADRSYALDPANSATAAVWGGIRYDMDSTAFAAANPLDPTATPLPEFERKDGKFRFLVEDDAPALSARLRGADDAGWKPLEGSAREAQQIGELLQKAGFQTEVLSEYAASEERFKSLGQEAPSPRILHVATHGFAYPDPKKTPQQRLSGEEPVYKIQNDPMLRAGLLLAGANYYWAAKRPLQNREDGVLVAYEVRDLNLRNTELAVLSACQTGLGDVVGSEGVYGLQRAFRIAGAKFLIVSLWQVPDEQTRALMRLFYENWTDKGESLRDAFNHAQATLRGQEPNPYMWAGFLLIE